MPVPSNLISIVLCINYVYVFAALNNRMFFSVSVVEISKAVAEVWSKLDLEIQEQ